MKRVHVLRLVSLCTVLGVPFFVSHPALAASADISSIQTFIQNIIQALAGVAGLIATGFFVVGGIHYITSSGNPHSLERAKRTVMFAALGLAITIGSFVLSNIVTNLATSAFGK